MNTREKIAVAAKNYKKHITGLSDALIDIMETIPDAYNPNHMPLVEYGGHFKHKIFFENGYGISLVYHENSYGLECGLIHKDVTDGIIQNCKEFNTEWDSVRGHLDGEGLLEALTIVKNLKPIKDE